MAPFNYDTNHLTTQQEIISKNRSDFNQAVSEALEKLDALGIPPGTRVITSKKLLERVLKFLQDNYRP